MTGEAKKARNEVLLRDIYAKLAGLAKTPEAREEAAKSIADFLGDGPLPDFDVVDTATPEQRLAGHAVYEVRFK